MSHLLKNVTNSIWHAFQALATPGDECVAKSKLKVLTANIASILDLQGVEKGLDHFRSTQNLNFQYYKYYLLKEVFSCIPKELPLLQLREYERKVDEICWLICKNKYLSYVRNNLSEDNIFMLFRVFCLLSEDIETEVLYQIKMDRREVGLLVSQLVTSLGTEWDQAEFESFTQDSNSLPFTDFLNLLSSKYLKGTDKEGVSEAILCLVQTFVEDVLKKGLLLKRGYLLPTLREYWFVLRPTQLIYYKFQDEKQQCGTITLDARCFVTSNLQRIMLHTMERTFEFAPLNHRSRLQWISALKLAIRHSGGHFGYQRTLAARRRLHRQADSIEKERRSSFLHNMGAQLQAERVARAAAEEQVEQVRVESKKQVGQLEALLAEETQAKRDEEIVRNLQARVLREEWQKREELEQLQEEQRLLLIEERQKRIEFEQKQRENEARLIEAERKLRELEGEREQLDAELSNARHKILSLSNSNEIEKKDGVTKIRRTMSMLPSCKSRQNTATE